MSEMNKKFLKELEKEEQKEKITIQDLHQICRTLVEQNEKIISGFSSFKQLDVKIEKSHLSLLGNVLNRLKNINIPEEIKLQKINTIDIANTTRKWLLYYFVCSLLIVILSLGVTFYSYQYEYTPKKELEITDKQNEWMLNYIESMGKKTPETHNEFVKNNPFPE